MTKRFYDKQGKCIRNTNETYEHYKKYFSDLYSDFFDYMKAVFPNYVWIDD